MTDIVFDAVVIDYVFQPISDRLARWHSCFDLARVFCDGSTLALVVTVALMDTADWRLNVPLAFAVGFLMVYYRHLIGALERKQKPGLMNSGRFHFQMMRITCIIITSSNALSLMTSNPRYWHVLGDLLWLLSAYFASCNDNPPTLVFKRQAEAMS